MLKKLKNKFINKCEELNELGKCLADEEYIHNKLSNPVADKTTMLRLDREELIARCRGFSKEDWEIIINEAPIEFCHNRIGRELLKAKRIEQRGRAIFDEVKE